MSEQAEKGYLHRRSENFAKVPEELMHDLSLTDGAVRLYAHMHWRYGNNCDNHESRKSMAKYLGVSQVAISKRVALLVQRDWIVIEPNFDSTGRTSNIYHVFELQSDCRRWRDDHNMPKPEPEEPVVRKSRKGLGGKPSHKPGETVQVSALVRKPELTGVLNSGLHDPEALDPESLLSASQITVNPPKESPGSSPAAPMQASLFDNTSDAPPAKPNSPIPPLGFPPSPKKPRKPKPEPKPWSALSKAMHEATPESVRPVRCFTAKHNLAAKALYDSGFTPADITAYVTSAYLEDRYIRGDRNDGQPVVIWMGYVVDNIKSWRIVHPVALPEGQDRPPYWDSDKGKYFKVENGKKLVLDRENNSWSPV